MNRFVRNPKNKPIKNYKQQLKFVAKPKNKQKSILLYAHLHKHTRMKQIRSVAIVQLSNKEEKQTFKSYTNFSAKLNYYYTTTTTTSTKLYCICKTANYTQTKKTNKHIFVRWNKVNLSKLHKQQKIIKKKFKQRGKVRA